MPPHRICIASLMHRIALPLHRIALPLHHTALRCHCIALPIDQYRITLRWIALPLDRIASHRIALHCHCIASHCHCIALPSHRIVLLRYIPHIHITQHYALQDEARRRGSSRHSDFEGSVKGASFAFGRHSKEPAPLNSRRPSSAPRTGRAAAGSRSPNRSLLVDNRTVDDDVASRYMHHQEEKDLNRYSTRWDGRRPDSASSTAPSSSSGKSNSNSSSGNYRVASTRGQASRDGHAAHNNNNNNNNLNVTWSDNRDTSSHRKNQYRDRDRDSDRDTDINGDRYSDRYATESPSGFIAYSGYKGGSGSNGNTFASSHSNIKVQQRFR
jgi:hypothetical protein